MLQKEEIDMIKYQSLINEDYNKKQINMLTQKISEYAKDMQDRNDVEFVFNIQQMAYI